ncbi:T9SS type A sorting domain-containing protein [Flavobacterium dankookense]|uniref:Putative secreted protein (Por secretion system target) n=1 Tax=Flavobacterium dankookense TaxID=706186 RepID=A0A4R6QH98_9FLAO|nr:T9SS type A sorting domain-containing protein [Flavobacterium dankookense]TDP61971.1 putative secreted protein (Por secretion system target) [Flavobacterium dankookense]
MKKLLLSLTVLFSYFNVHAQADCANAIAITTNGTISVPTITGTFLGNCAGTTNATQNAMWYVYTPSANGEVTVSSDLVANAGGDTTVSIITTTGSCTGYQCYNGSDDVSGTNYLTTLTFPVQAGQAYYIVWDDGWSDAAFSFDFNFTPSTCVRPNDFAVFNPTAITTTSANVNWTEAIGVPAGYDVQYGDEDFVLGSGTTVNVTAAVTTNLTGLTSSGIIDYYLRSNCGTLEQSGWIGPFKIYLADVLPYSNGFETPQFADGFTSSGGSWSLGNAANGAQGGSTNYYFSFSSTTEAVDDSLFSRAISLQANEQVTLTFFTRLGAATGSPQTLKVWANTDTNLIGATQLGANITVSGVTYVSQTRTFTATTAGTYYFIFNNASPIVTTATSLRLDTVSMTSVLSNNEFLASNLSVYPNPTKNIIYINNNLNAVVNSIEMSDLNGRVVKTQMINAAEGQVSISDLSAGVYLMKVVTDQGTATKKVIKE